MKKIMMIAAMMVMTIAAKAQNEVGQITLKPMVGLTLTTLTDLDESKLKGGIVAGVEAEYGVSNLLGISAGLLYTMQGCTFSDYTSVYSGVTNGIKDQKNEFDYINIPILANFYVAKGFALKVGVQPGFLVSAKHKQTTITNSQETDVDNDVKDNCKTFDFSIPLGASYTFGDNWTIDARYNLGLTKVNKVDDSYSMKNSVIMVTVGYKFGL